MYVVTFFCLAASFFEVYATNQYNLKGKTAIVTGGAKGTGFAIADNFLKEGVKIVYIIDINEPLGMQAESELNCIYGPNRVVFICADVTKDLDRVTAILDQSSIQVDILVNNAGIGDDNEAENTIITNSLAPILWSRRFIEKMRKDRGGKGGTIINIASRTSYVRDPFYPIYKASKYALIGYTYCMGHEYNFLTQRVRMFAVCAGPTYTDLARQLKVTKELEEVYKKYLKALKWQEPDAVGKATALLYHTAESGTAYTVEGGEPPYKSPDSVTFTADYLRSL